MYICITDLAAYYQAFNKIVSWISDWKYLIYHQILSLSVAQVDWSQESEFSVLIWFCSKSESEWNKIFFDEMRQNKSCLAQNETEFPDSDLHKNNIVHKK